MQHNGFDFARKKNFGKVKIGKQSCPCCGNQHHEDKTFWKNLLSEFQETIVSLIYLLRDSDVAWKTASKIMDYIVPYSKDTLRSLFSRSIEKFEYSQSNYLIVNYDEQHPKKGRTQKFRLTLLNYKTRTPIAEGLFDNKNDETLEKFLRENLDTSKEIVLITDCDRRYPALFKKIWGGKIIHQKCLLHLNKLVSKDFGNNLTLLNMYNKYLVFNIFYNRKKELRFLSQLLRKQDKKQFANADEKKEWIKKAKQNFYDYLRMLENERRRNEGKLTQRKLSDAKKIFEILWQEKSLFPKKVQKRLDMIDENWKYFTAFYSVKDCPATNNAVENYYSTSLKTHRKKQLRTDKGILDHMKLTAFKRIQGFAKPKKTIIDIYEKFKLIVT